MKFGNASWGFRETPLERQFEITRNMKLEILELGIAGHANDYLQADATDDEIAKVKELFSKYGMKPLCASTGNDFTLPDEEACMQELDRVKQAVDIASLIRIKHIRIFAGFSPADKVTGKRWERQIECIKNAVDYAAPKNVVIAVETHGGVEGVSGGVKHYHSTSSKPDTLFKIIDEVGEGLGVVFDPANLGAVGLNNREIIEIYRKLEKRISYMHLKDFKIVESKNPQAQSALLPCACGEGQLNWQLLLEAFSPFCGYGVLEYEQVEDIEEGLKRTLETLG
jgi:sugar phosphate isomerase/epimerase